MGVKNNQLANIPGVADGGGLPQFSGVSVPSGTANFLAVAGASYRIEPQGGAAYSNMQLPPSPALNDAVGYFAIAGAGNGLRIDPNGNTIAPANCSGASPTAGLLTVGDANLSGTIVWNGTEWVWMTETGSGI